eukprot:TRINITY_DN6127_c0_g1_i3.p1 TRINITY_DN6127_c0_g1~~TRINITY_DN6127_c0_g1_i3.p1  ORF type:complete len:194 (-),score=26.91 TRINITY_DN6127_c0_g1_i3:10-534(-)
MCGTFGHGCFMFYFSGHGTVDSIIGDDMKYVSRADLVDIFQPEKCPALSYKPKIFLWDCCRGPQTDSKIPLIQTKEDTMKTLLISDENIEQPRSTRGSSISPTKLADCLFAYATVNTYKAYCPSDKTSGKSLWTYFLQETLKMYGKKWTFTDILTHTQSQVTDFCRKRIEMEAN